MQKSLTRISGHGISRSGQISGQELPVRDLGDISGFLGKLSMELNCFMGLVA